MSRAPANDYYNDGGLAYERLVVTVSTNADAAVLAVAVAVTMTAAAAAAYRNKSVGILRTDDAMTRQGGSLTAASLRSCSD